MTSSSAPQAGTTIDCPSCEGHGFISSSGPIDDHETCYECKGSGRAQAGTTAPAVRPQRMVGGSRLIRTGMGDQTCLGDIVWAIEKQGATLVEIRDAASEQLRLGASLMPETAAASPPVAPTITRAHEKYLSDLLYSEHGEDKITCAEILSWVRSQLEQEKP